jgi:hypothetical protein
MSLSVGKQGLIGVALILAACAGMPGREPVHVTVAGIEGLPSEGMEMRLLVKLRVQNPSDAPIEYDGAYLRMEVLDKTFATGVSNERGTVPRFGDALVNVPVTISTISFGLNLLGMFASGVGPPGRINYRMEGKLNGPLFGSSSFQAAGEFALPR